MQDIAHHLQSLLATVSDTESLRWRIEWLLEVKERSPSILNPGCKYGYETLGLLWFLNADSAIGIDVEADAISWANRMAEDFKEDLGHLRDACRNAAGIPPDLASQAASAVATYGELPLPAFKQADITQQIDLQGSSYDLAYCHKVLYKLTSTTNQGSWRDPILEAIRQVSRLLVAGGLFVAIEPLTRSPTDPTPLDLARLFAQAGLEQVDVTEVAPQIDGKAVACFAKS
jgi:SAM-dependent methyltransferase